MSDAARYALRRQDHAIQLPEEIDALLRRALVARLGVIADGEPYVVPMNFAWDGRRIVVHGASQGRLISALRQNPRVCVEVDEFVATMPNPVLCKYDTAYASVIAYGRARVLEALAERTEALRELARKYATVEEAAGLKERTVESYRSALGSETAVIEIEVETLTGKRQPFAPPVVKLRTARESRGPDLSAVGTIRDDDRYYARVVAPGEPLVLPRAVLKWYELRRPEVVVPRSLVREARAFIARETEAGRFDLGYGLGFVLLHDSDDGTSLMVGLWREHQELWETHYLRRREEPSFYRVTPGVDALTLCGWELAPVWHERQAWVRYLDSPRQEADRHAWLEDVLAGPV